MMVSVGFGEVIGGCLAIITLGMPAILALVKFNQIHVAINSRLTQLLDATSKASHIQGRLEGRLELQREFEKLASNIIEEATVKAKIILEEAAVKARQIIDDAASSSHEKTSSTGLEDAGKP